MIQTGIRKTRDAVSILGPPHATEWASDAHRAIRNVLDEFCPETGGLFTLREAKRGLDYVLVKGDFQFALRWGHVVQGKIKRNGTVRTMNMHDQALLSDDFDFEHTIEELSVLTIGCHVTDRHTHAGQPQWFLNRLDLVRERSEDLQLLCVLKRFESPCPDVWMDDPDVIVKARQDDLTRLKKLFGTARRAG